MGLCDLVTQGARESAVIVLTKFFWNITVSTPEGWNTIDSLGPGDAILPHKISYNTDSGNGLLPDGTKPLPESMLTYPQLNTQEQSSA